MSNIDGDSSNLNDSEYFTILQQRIKDGAIFDDDLNEYKRRFGKSNQASKANLALITSKYKSRLISAAEYVGINFLINATSGTVTAADLQAVRRAWSGGLTGEDIKAVQADKKIVSKVMPSLTELTASITEDDIEYFASFRKKAKGASVSDDDLYEYASRFSKDYCTKKASLALVNLELKNKRISSLEYVVLNFLTKAAIGAVLAMDIKAVRQAWSGALTGEDIQAIQTINNKILETLSAGAKNSSIGDNEYFAVFQQKVKENTINDADIREYASRFGKDNNAIRSNLALTASKYKSMSPSEYVVLNLMIKAALGIISAADIKAAQRAWGRRLTDEDVQAVLETNNSIQQSLSVPESTKNQMDDKLFFKVFEQKVKSGVVSDADLEEYSKRFKNCAKDYLAEAAAEYKMHKMSASEYVVLNLTVKAALKSITAADIKAARKAWSKSLSGEDVDAVLVFNNAKNETTEFTPAPKVKSGCSELGDNEFFELYRQKVVSNNLTDNDLKEYAARFGKDKEATKANYKIFTAQFKNNLISKEKYIELNFMAKAALGTLTPTDMKAVQALWGGILTDDDVQSVLAVNNLNKPKDEQKASSEDEASISSDLNDNEYFTAFQQRVISNRVTRGDMKEYAQRFGKDKDATKANFKFFTAEYRSNLIAPSKYLEIDFMTKAALGTATQADIENVRKLWSGELSELEAEAIVK